MVIEDPTTGGSCNGNTSHVAWTTSYGYDPLSSLLLVNQGGRNRSFAYDSFKRLLQANNPESGVINYTYDLVGNLVTKTDGRFETCYGTLSGSTCNSGYDALNRLTTKSYTDPNTTTINLTYDNAASGANGVGRLWQVSNGASTTTFSAYDAVGRIKLSSQTPQGTSQPYSFSYNYKLAGALTSDTYPSGRTITTWLRRSKSRGVAAGLDQQRDDELRRHFQLRQLDSIQPPRRPLEFHAWQRPHAYRRFQRAPATGAILRVLGQCQQRPSHAPALLSAMGHRRANKPNGADLPCEHARLEQRQPARLPGISRRPRQRRIAVRCRFAHIQSDVSNV